MAAQAVLVDDARDARVPGGQFKILLTTAVARAHFLEALAGLDGVTVEIAESAEAVGDKLAETDVMVGAGDARGYTREIAEQVAASLTLRWLHLVSAGTEALAAHGVPHHLLLTGPGTGVSAAVAEHALTVALALARGLPEAAAQQRDGRWNRELRGRMRCLRGAHALVVGLGAVGREVARLAAAIGMNVSGVNRSGRPVPGFDLVAPSATLLEVVGQADVLFLCLPERPATAGIFDAALLGRCKAGALLVNVGRGSAVEPRALLTALDTGRIGGAALDVTQPEPLPPDDPPWRAPGLLVTPHVAGAGDEETLRMMAQGFVENLRRFHRGEPLADQISGIGALHAHC